MKYLFVGERPSRKAVQMQVSWQDGKLAAKQLFDALLANEINPKLCTFDNVFQPTFGEEIVCKKSLKRILQKHNDGFTVIAMGNKVANILNNIIPFKKIVHPAARGKIRKKELYIQHIKEVLIGVNHV
jgi:hypothetical protein